MATFTYQTNAELNEIAQDKLPRLESARPIFELMPMEDTWTPASSSGSSSTTTPDCRTCAASTARCR
jgi:hypothetical protein